MESRSRTLLVCSLAGLLLLMAVTGAAGLIIIERIRANEASLRARFLERSRALEEVRGGIFLSGALARDYVADPDGPDGPTLLDRLHRIERVSTQSMERYAASAAGEVANLRGEVAAYWKVLNLMVEMASRRRTPALDAYFRTQLGQRRETMLLIAAQVGVALESEVKNREAELARIYSQFRWTMAGEIALVVALGSIISFAVTRRVVNLEAETRALSAQLVIAQETERGAIARELHDEIGQALTVLLLDVGAVSSITPPGPLHSSLGAIANSGERIVEEVRRIALSLRPSMLDDLGLASALEWQAREIGRRSGLNVELTADDGDGPLPESHSTCIYRVAQEALQNCVRHAAASRVRVALSRQNGAITLKVEDNGRGFLAARTRGLGLIGMEERISQLGGRLRVLSTPGQGTTISAELPL
jgi:signal transduction histidine kinase